MKNKDKPKEPDKTKLLPAHIPGCDTCVCCGEDIPEGSGMVCWKCLHGEVK